MKSVVILLSDSHYKELFFLRALQDDYHLRVAKEKPHLFDLLSYAHVDLLIVDEGFLGKEVGSVCIELRKKYPHLPILIITSSLQKSFIQELTKAGATDFIWEPLSEEEIRHRIAVAIQLKSTEGKAALLSEQFEKGESVKPKSLTTRLIMNEKVMELLSSIEFHPQSLSVIFLEIDQKDILSSLGEEISLETVIRPIESKVKLSIRKNDLIVRIDPSTLAILLPKTSETAAKHIAELVKESIGSLRIGKGPFEKMTLSLGVATLSTLMNEDIRETFDLLVRAASRALKEAKQHGNMIVSLWNTQHRA